MPPLRIRHFRPSAYVPTSSFTGAEHGFLLRAENLWIRLGNTGTACAECFTGNEDLSETIASTALTGTLAFSPSSRTVTGTGTSFLSELHIGQFILSKDTVDNTIRDVLVVESITSDTSFVACRVPTVTTTTSNGYRLPIMFPVGTKRGTALRGKVIQFPRGHYLGVGDGEFKVNGSALNSTLNLSKTPQLALLDPSAGTYTINSVGVTKPAAPPTLTAVTSPTAISAATNASPIVITSTAHPLANGDQITISGVLGNTAANGTWTVANKTANTLELTGSTGNGTYTSGGTIFPSQMRAGDYNVRICGYNTSTKGFSNPSDVTGPVTLTAGQSIKLTNNVAMTDDIDAYLVFCTPWKDNDDADIEGRYQGPWYKVREVTADQLKDATHPTGRETGTSITFAFQDAELESSFGLLSFDNFQPVDAGFVETANSIPIYMSCLGKANSTDTEGTTPGPVAVASKPNNIEAVLLNKAVTTVDNDYILGSLNANGKVYTMCQNSLQELVTTGFVDDPIAFKSLWDVGFRNPYNVKFVKNYLYGFSTQGIVRSIAVGDESTLEFEFASDMYDLIKNWNAGHVIVGEDPKNRAVCFFYCGAEKRSNYFVTICLPYMIDQGNFNPPIIIKAADRDMIVSGVATVGENLEFLCGGMKSNGTVQVDTFRFDGGDTETKDWYLAWNFSDEGVEMHPKIIKGLSATARVTSGEVEIHGVKVKGQFSLSTLEAGHGDSDLTWDLGTTANLERYRKVARDWAPYSLWTLRASGSCTDGLDSLHEIVAEVEVNTSDM